MFPDDSAVKKAVYLSLQQAAKKWHNSIADWRLIANQFTIIYPERCKINILANK